MRSSATSSVGLRVAVVRAVGSAADALMSLDVEPVDALFLDIRMPGLGGLDLARILAKLREAPRIVFVTARDEHAVEAFDLRAVDYLLKPVDEVAVESGHCTVRLGDDVLQVSRRHTRELRDRLVLRAGPGRSDG